MKELAEKNAKLLRELRRQQQQQPTQSPSQNGRKTKGLPAGGASARHARMMCIRRRGRSIRQSWGMIMGGRAQLGMVAAQWPRKGLLLSAGGRRERRMGWGRHDDNDVHNGGNENMTKNTLFYAILSRGTE